MRAVMIMPEEGGLTTTKTMLKVLPMTKVIKQKINNVEAPTYGPNHAGGKLQCCRRYYGSSYGVEKTMLKLPTMDPSMLLESSMLPALLLPQASVDNINVEAPTYGPNHAGGKLNVEGPTICSKHKQEKIQCCCPTNGSSHQWLCCDPTQAPVMPQEG